MILKNFFQSGIKSTQFWMEGLQSIIQLRQIVTIVMMKHAFGTDCFKTLLTEILYWLVQMNLAVLFLGSKWSLLRWLEKLNRWLKFIIIHLLHSHLLRRLLGSACWYLRNFLTLANLLFSIPLIVLRHGVIHLICSFISRGILTSLGWVGSRRPSIGFFHKELKSSFHFFPLWFFFGLTMQTLKRIHWLMGWGWWLWGFLLFYRDTGCASCINEIRLRFHSSAQLLFSLVLGLINHKCSLFLSSQIDKGIDLLINPQTREIINCLG